MRLMRDCTYSFTKILRGLIISSDTGLRELVRNRGLPHHTHSERTLNDHVLVNVEPVKEVPLELDSSLRVSWW